MTTLKAQYFLGFAALGSLVPFLPLFLRERGLNDAQIGYVFSLASVAILLTPALLAMVADVHVSPRRLLAVMFAVGAAALAGLLAAEAFLAILILYLAYSLTAAPIGPLQDGLNFSVQHQRRRANLPTLPYHRIRVWGTLGYIAPSVLLFIPLRGQAPTDIIVYAAIVCCLLGAVNAMRLPEIAVRGSEPVPSGQRLPTFGALKAMCQRHVLVFNLGMWLLQMAMAAYYGFYPLYLISLGIDRAWVGLIAMIGVVIEIFFMLSYGWIIQRLGLKGFMTLGALAIAVRMALLGAFPIPAIAIGTQAFHGIMALVAHVAPPVFLDRHAKDQYRNSMQGLYTMVTLGSGRIIGSVVAGHVAMWSLPGLFGYTAGLSLLAVGLFAFAFEDKPHSQPQSPTSQSDTGEGDATVTGRPRE